MIRLLRLLRDAPGAVEADLLTVYGPSLPEWWRAERVPSMRRLCVIVANLGEQSAVRRFEREGMPEWTAAAQVVDDLRRAWASVHQKDDAPYPPAHPMSPLRPTEAQIRARKREAAKKKAAQVRREQARQERLAARKEVDDG